MSFENNNDNNNKKGKKTLYKFLDKQGFYLILLLCVSIVLVTAVWVSRQEEYFLSENPEEEIEEDFNRVEVTLVEEDSNKEDTNEEDTQEAAIVGKNDGVVESEPREKPPIENTTAKEKPKGDIELEESPRKQEIQKEEASDTPITTTTTTSSYVMAQPVIGKKGLGFAEDRLVYHQTLDHWSTHKGLDILAEEGTPVRAVLDGEVIEVTNDTIMGITIGLQHEGDLITRYCNLSTGAMVSVGEKVKKGEVISGVGRTAANKTCEGPLLHFQVLIGDKAVDPQIYLPNIN